MSTVPKTVESKSAGDCRACEEKGRPECMLVCLRIAVNVSPWPYATVHNGRHVPHAGLEQVQPQKHAAQGLLGPLWRQWPLKL